MLHLACKTPATKQTQRNLTDVTNFSSQPHVESGACNIKPRTNSLNHRLATIQLHIIIDRKFVTNVKNNSDSIMRMWVA